MPLYYYSFTNELAVSPVPQTLIVDAVNIVAVRDWWYSGGESFNTLIGINKINKVIYNGGGWTLYDVNLESLGFPPARTSKYVRATNYDTAKEYTIVNSGIETNWQTFSITNLGQIQQITT